MLKNNLNSLKINNNKLALKIADTIAVDNYTIEDTKDQNVTAVWSHKNGDREVKTYLHSRYTPLKEAERFADAQYHDGPITLYGFGLGYHVKTLFEKLTNGQTLTVFEASLPLLKLALSLFDFSKMFESQAFRLIGGVETSGFIVGIHQRTLLSKKIIVHSASINCINDNNGELKSELFNYLLSDTGEERKSLAVSNHQANVKRDTISIDDLYGKHLGKTALIVSSGPSLASNIEKIKNANSEEVVILAASSAVAPLISNDIYPDYIFMMDPRHEIKRHLKNFNLQSTPLIFANFTSKEAVDNHSGNKYMYFTESIDGVDSAQILDVGGSVATVAFIVAIKMGCNRIALLGQDLCYVEGQHHVENAGKLQDVSVVDLDNHRRVKNVEDNWVSTAPNYLNYRKWFETAIERYSDIEVYNCTKHGLPIKGAQLGELDNILEKN